MVERTLASNELAHVVWRDRREVDVTVGEVLPERTTDRAPKLCARLQRQVPHWSRCWSKRCSCASTGVVPARGAAITASAHNTTSK
jgi:hypothetical protein